MIYLDAAQTNDDEVYMSVVPAIALAPQRTRSLTCDCRFRSLQKLYPGHHIITMQDYGGANAILQFPEVSWFAWFASKLHETDPMALI